jgi:hypothetical protein
VYQPYAFASIAVISGLKPTLLAYYCESFAVTWTTSYMNSYNANLVQMNNESAIQAYLLFHKAKVVMVLQTLKLHKIRSSRTISCIQARDIVIIDLISFRELDIQMIRANYSNAPHNQFFFMHRILRKSPSELSHYKKQMSTLPRAFRYNTTYITWIRERVVHSMKSSGLYIREIRFQRASKPHLRQLIERSCCSLRIFQGQMYLHFSRLYHCVGY